MATTISILLLIIAATAQAARMTFREATGSPIKVDPTLNCAISELAWEFAKKFLPQRGDFKSAYDALRLSACDVPLTSERRYEPRPFRHQPKLSSDVASGNLNGNDANVGTLSDPVQTLHRAVEIYRENRAGASGVIYVHGGT